MSTGPCPNCGQPFDTPFCPACGQKRIDRHDYSLAHFSSHALHDVTHFDSKIFRSAAPLLLRPGFLTAEYLAGRRGRYILPTTLFVLVNLVFFAYGIKSGLFRWGFESSARAWPASLIAEPLIAKAIAAKTISREALRDQFDAKSVEWKRYIFFLSIPLLAAALALVWFPLRRYYVEHLIYSIHFHAFYLIFLLTIFPLARRFAHWTANDHVIAFIARDPSWLLILTIAAYHLIALPRVYGVNRWLALPGAALITWLFLVILVNAVKPLVFVIVMSTI